MISTQTIAATTSVETRLMTTERAPCRLRKARRSSSTALTARACLGRPGRVRVSSGQANGAPGSLQEGRLALAAEPLGGELVERAVLAQRVDGGGHLRGERRVLGEHEAELVARRALGVGSWPTSTPSVSSTPAM